MNHEPCEPHEREMEAVKELGARICPLCGGMTAFIPVGEDGEGWAGWVCLGCEWEEEA